MSWSDLSLCTDVYRVLGNSAVGRLRLRTRNVEEGIGDLNSRNSSDDGVHSPQRARLVLAGPKGHNAEVHERTRGEEVNVVILES
jgi:hypothetical protein